MLVKSGLGQAMTEWVSPLSSTAHAIATYLIDIISVRPSVHPYVRMYVCTYYTMAITMDKGKDKGKGGPGWRQGKLTSVNKNARRYC